MSATEVTVIATLMAIMRGKYEESVDDAGGCAGLLSWVDAPRAAARTTAAAMAPEQPLQSGTEME